jgi:hypothetical protein
MGSPIWTIDRELAGSYDRSVRRRRSRTMKDIRPLELTDLQAVKAHLQRHPPEISELTFTNLFVWRSARPIFLAQLKDAIVFMTNTREENSEDKLIFGNPVGEAPPLAAANSLGSQVAGFARIPLKTAEALQEADLEVECDRDNWDYVYHVADLANLSGRRYHKKRNLIKQCLATYSCQYEPMTRGLMAECFDMQDRWCKARNCGREPGLCNEYVAIREAFSLFEQLQLIGGVVRVDGIIQAYAIGEELRPAMAVCHFEKAMPGFHGLGQLINQWFAKYSLAEFQFINREQDMGIPGLRQAKESYYPHHMVEKFNASLAHRGLDKALPVEPHECYKHGLLMGA